MGCTVPSFSNLTVQSNFSLQNFLGIWYEIQWLSSEYHNASSIWSDYSQSFQLENNVSQRLLVYGKARFPNAEQCFSFGPWLIIANNSAKMILQTQDVNSSKILNWPYYILKTDYNHSALIYACMSENYTQNDPCNKSVLWIFSRKNSLSNEYLNELYNYIENILCVDSTKLEITPQSERSCYTSSSLGLKICLMNKFFFLILHILYLLQIYK
ncbi:unnamed protein product [Rotaria sp. Silwood1]|nr:unnamed protein product [Rotaria sp. Silwood1]CAF3419959.1 unnamed protein product [Rotaria sp. Silwood1]CAF3431503.1 unnamed protein product [Rotaria sp. Silwood1]CAF3435723.1 unnamed protein product [Rotaria sp. Silwood1]CAF4556433.1 unnamed protein product [Rotaria sp. Silwood1]